MNRGKTRWQPQRYIMENRGTIVTIIISAIIIFMIGRNLLHAFNIWRDIGVLESDREIYQESITRDSTLLESLKYDKELERYARENYFMHRKNEEIFIIK